MNEKTISLPKFKVVLNTNGDGFWSHEKRNVTHSKATIDYNVNKDYNLLFGEMFTY